MQVDDLPSIDPNVDYTKILPIQQKRMVTFINDLVMNTVNFLNNFAQSCESRLMEFEYKIEKVEASLMILESQLASISGLDLEDGANPTPLINNEKEETEPQTPVMSVGLPDVGKPPAETPKTENSGPTASQDLRFQKFFKMLQFGVPPPGVKQKMLAEGIDPDILDTPNAIIPGYSLQISPNDDDDSDASNSS